MSADSVIAPEDMATPTEVELRTSGVDPLKIGIWAKMKITEGSKFGPFEGKKVQEASDNMDSAFVWEIVDEDTKDFLFYIDATESGIGNWMKFIGCARFFEEQNIVSQQEGTEIFYKAIKDIDPGHELLTWYEKIPVRKKRGRKKKTNDDASSRSSTPTVDIYSKKYKANPKRKVLDNRDSDDDQVKRPKRIQKKSSKYSEFTDSEYISDGYISASSDELRAKSASPVHKKKKVSQKTSINAKESKSKENSDVEDVEAVEDKLPEEEDDEVFEDDDIDSMSVCSSSLKLDQEGAASGLTSRTSSVAESDKFQFDLKEHHIVKRGLGRKVFKCDICMAVYRHAFSLKRHYIRNHINYTYVTKGDLQNCQITSEALETLTMARALQKKQVEQVELVKIKNDVDVEQKSVSEKGNYGQSNVQTGDVADKPGTSDLLLSPGKDENRNKIADGAKGDVQGKNDSNSAVDNTVQMEQEPCKNVEDTVADDVNDCKKAGISDSEALVIDIKLSCVDERNGNKELESPATDETNGKRDDTGNVGGEVRENVNKDHIPPDQSEKSNGNVQHIKEVPSKEKSGTDGDSISEVDKKKEDTPQDLEKVDAEGDKYKTAIQEQFLALFRCNVCNFCFDTIKELKVHIEDHPDMPNMKAFGCDKCDMRFSHKQNLVRHQAVHTGAKPFTCRYCGKNFPTVTNQKRHERIHLGRRVQCEYCASSFTQSGDLKKHTRKLHPEHFHECAFCAKYYSSQKELITHLDTHNENFASNKEEENRRRQEFRVDMEKDREESMRLAESKPGYKFACTVCKKRFHDYANMCRHRRLAHQRHLLTSKKVRICNSIDGHIDGKKSISDSLLFDLEPNSYFYNNVARNISENLKYFVEGGMDDMQNNAAYIRWKSAESNGQNVKRKPVNKTNSLSTGNKVQDTDEVFTKYNFPTGFKLKENYTEVIDDNTGKEKNHEKALNKKTSSYQDTVTEHSVVPLTVPRPSPLVLPPVPKRQSSLPNGLFRPYRLESPAHVSPPVEPGERTFDNFQISSGTVSQLEALPEPQSAPYNFSTKPDSGKSQDLPTPFQNTVLPIRTPSVKICTVCRSIFSNEEMYSKHMMDKHKIAVESSISSQKENLPVFAAHSIPAVVSEVTISSTHLSPPAIGLVSGSKSPRTCLNVPQFFKSSKSYNAVNNHIPPSIGNTGVIDLSPSASQEHLVAPPVLDLTKSSENVGRSSVVLSCEEISVSPKAKVNKSPKGKSPINRVVLQTPKIIPRFESPFHKSGAKDGNKSRGDSSTTNGIIVPFFPPPVLDLTKNADISGLGGYQEVDMCMQAGAVDFTLNRETEKNDKTPTTDTMRPEKPLSSAGNVTPTPAQTPAQTPRSWAYRPCYNPNPVGLLNVCSSQVPSQPEKVRYNCTKCSKKFSIISSLHAHILECASEGKGKEDSAERMQPKYVFKKGLGRISIQSKKIPSASQLKLKAAIGFQKKMFMGKKKTSAFFTGKDEEYYNGDSAASKRRRSFELMYNPQNHMRRRELTEVLDMHRCHGCGLRFGTISLLERHIRVCKHKEKIKEMHLNKTAVTRRVHKRPKDSFVQDAHKQKCRYCDKLFTYIGMLKKHILDICPVRKEYFEHGNADHIDKEWEETIMCLGGGGATAIAGFVVTPTSNNVKESVSPDNMSDGSECSKAGRKRKGRGRRKNRKWGNQNKNRRRSTEKGRNEEDSGDEDHVVPKSPDSFQNSDTARDEDGNYSDDTEASVREQALTESVPQEAAAENITLETDPKENLDSTKDVINASMEADDPHDQKQSVTDDSDKEKKCDYSESSLNVENNDEEEDKNVENTDGLNTTLEAEVSVKNTLAKEIANVSGLPRENENLASSETVVCPVPVTKSLFDLDSTIARLKERTNAISQVEPEIQNETVTSPIKTKSKKKKVQVTKDEDDSVAKTPKQSKQKVPKKKALNQTEKITKKKGLKENSSKDSELKQLKGERTDSVGTSVVKPAAKRGRKPKSLVSTTLINSSEALNLANNLNNNPLSNGNSTQESEPLGEEAIVGNGVKSKSENSQGVSNLKKTSKVGVKSRKKKTGSPVLENTVETTAVENTKNESVANTKSKSNEVPETIAKPKKGGRKKKSEVQHSDSKDSENFKQMEIVPNGLITSDAPPRQPKAKRGPKKRKNTEMINDDTGSSSLMNAVSTKISKSQKLQTAGDCNGTTEMNDENPTPNPPRRGRKLGKKHPVENVDSESQITVVRKKPGPKKKVMSGEEKNLLTPEFRSVRSTSRSASRSTSRSRSRSVHRDLTPPPTKKVRISTTKSQSDTQNTLPGAGAKSRKALNGKVKAEGTAKPTPLDKRKPTRLLKDKKSTAAKGRGKSKVKT